VVAYTIDLEPGNHSYAFADGIGECRDHFRRLVEDLDKGVADIVMAAKASFLFIDTSPLWMEKFIATMKRHHVLIVDATSQREYALNKPADETVFRELGKK
jgi:hypothetical protein